MTYLTRMKAVDLAELVTELGIYHPVSIKIDRELQRRMARGSLQPRSGLTVRQPLQAN